MPIKKYKLEIVLLLMAGVNQTLYILLFFRTTWTTTNLLNALGEKGNAHQEKGTVHVTDCAGAGLLLGFESNLCLYFCNYMKSFSTTR